MASGDTIGHVYQSMAPGPSINRADPGVIQATTSQENFPVLRFDDALVESFDLLCGMDNAWNGTASIEFELVWCTQGTPDGTVNWELEVRRLNAGETIDAAFAYTSPQATVAPQSPGQRQLVYTSVTFTAAQVDGLQPGERFNLRITRNDSAAQSGDVELLWPALAIREA